MTAKLACTKSQSNNTGSGVDTKHQNTHLRADRALSNGSFKIGGTQRGCMTSQYRQD